METMTSRQSLPRNVKFRDDEASPTAKISRNANFPDRTSTAADELMTKEPDDEKSETRVATKQSKKSVESNTEVSPADKAKFAAKSKKRKVDIYKTPTAKKKEKDDYWREEREDNKEGGG
jgi:hypothetical protein